MGNQLFQYCFGKWLSSSRQIRIFYDARSLSNSQTPRTFELSAFSLYHSRETDFILSDNGGLAGGYAAIIRRISLQTEQDIDRGVASGYFEGYWQDHRFVDAVFDDKSFTFIRPPTLSPFPASMAGRTLVAVHVRGGDYLSHPTLVRLTRNYYLTGMEYLSRMGEDPVFCVFTDDREYARQLLAGVSCHFLPSGGTVEDLYWMSLCNHLIMANSTFSWWASMLNSVPSRMVVCPSRWQDGSASRLIRPEFITIDP